MACHAGNLLLSLLDLRRRQMHVDVLAHMLQLGGRRHPAPVWWPSRPCRRQS
jgi:hypothetical protein